MGTLLKKIPELSLLILLTVIGYAIMGIFSEVTGTEILTPTAMWGIVAGSFVASTFIAVIAVVAGIGGGVLFTPVVMAFTSMDTLIVRATGLVVAMFSGLISTGPFMRTGLSDIRITFFASVPIILGALSGSFAAIYLAAFLGATGDAIVRLLLGCILIFIATMFILGGSKTEFPVPKAIDSISEKLGLRGCYFEQSIGKRIDYKLTKSMLGVVLFTLVGFTGGFFGLGGGWAVVPVLNLVMCCPLKVAAACSGVLLAIGNATAVWPYIMTGAMIPVFVAPWMVGQVVGGLMGAYILAKIKAGVVRKILIVILFLTSFKLVSRGLETLLGIDIPVL